MTPEELKVLLYRYTLWLEGQGIIAFICTTNAREAVKQFLVADPSDIDEWVTMKETFEKKKS